MTTQPSKANLKPWQIWLLATRPKTLPAAAAPVVVGTALAYMEGTFQPGPALAALLAAFLLQIGANVANDVFDYLRGADTPDRTGPLRVTQAGLLSPQQVLVGMWIIFALAGLTGLYLAWVAGWPVILVGLLAILAALAYTGGPLPFGYYGLGDLFVFIFFGLVAVMGTYYVQARELTWLAFLCSLPMGFLITALLVVNNLRDIDTDRTVGKQTLAVRLGASGARIEYLLCLLGAYLVPPGLWLAGLVPVWVMLSWLSLPLTIPLVRRLYREKGRPLNLALAGTGRLTLIYAILFGLGLLLA